MDRSMPSTERETTAARLIILMGMPGLEVRESEGCLLVICWLVLDREGSRLFASRALVVV